MEAVVLMVARGARAPRAPHFRGMGLAPLPHILALLIASERLTTVHSLLLHHLDQPHIDVLPAAGLLAVDGDRVRAGLHRLH